MSESIDIIQSHNNLNSFLLEANRNLNEREVSKQKCYLYGSISYRLGIIPLGLRLFNNSIIKQTNEARLHFHQLNSNQVKWKLTKSELNYILAQLFSKNIYNCSDRIKSYFSFANKHLSKGDTYDFYGFQISLSEDIFFSKSLIQLIESIGQIFSIVTLSTKLIEKEFLPFIILKVNHGKFEFQLKICCSNYHYSNLSYNYFNYKKFNFDNIDFTNSEKINRIMLFSKLEKAEIGQHTFSKTLFEEIKNKTTIGDIIQLSDQKLVEYKNKLNSVIEDLNNV